MPRGAGTAAALFALFAVAGALGGCGGEPTPPSTGSADGRQVYLTQCATCHGADRKGVAGNPALTPDTIATLGADQVRSIIVNGKGRMAGFGGKLSGDQLDALVAYLTSG
jgi:mono/diheme cytochrome c family protein